MKTELSHEKHSTNNSSLPGLRVVREHLRILQTEIARQLDMSATQVWRIEKTSVSTRVDLLKPLAVALCCSVDDLLSEPDEQRLREIKAAYLRRAADEAEREVA